MNDLIIHHLNTLEISQVILEGEKSDAYIDMETLIDTIATLDEDKLKALLEITKVL